MLLLAVIKSRVCVTIGVIGWDEVEGIFMGEEVKNLEARVLGGSIMWILKNTEN